MVAMAVHSVQIEVIDGEDQTDTRPLESEHSRPVEATPESIPEEYDPHSLTGEGDLHAHIETPEETVPANIEYSTNTATMNSLASVTSLLASDRIYRFPVSLFSGNR